MFNQPQTPENLNKWHVEEVCTWLLIKGWKYGHKSKYEARTAVETKLTNFCVLTTEQQISAKWITYNLCQLNDSIGFFVGRIVGNAHRNSLSNFITWQNSVMPYSHVYTPHPHRIRVPMTSGVLYASTEEMAVLQMYKHQGTSCYWHCESLYMVTNCNE